MSNRDDILDDAAVQFIMACDLLNSILSRNNGPDPDYLPWGGIFSEKPAISYLVPGGEC